MNPQFTPGPWHLDGFNLSNILHKISDYENPNPNSPKAEYGVIARVVNKNWKADARLIAAAPEMFEALKMARNTFAKLRAHPAFPWKNQEGMGVSIENIIDAALAKAIGDK